MARDWWDQARQSAAGFARDAEHEARDLAGHAQAQAQRAARDVRAATANAVALVGSDAAKSARDHHIAQTIGWPPQVVGRNPQQAARRYAVVQTRRAVQGAPRTAALMANPAAAAMIHDGVQGLSAIEKHIGTAFQLARTGSAEFMRRHARELTDAIILLAPDTGMKLEVIQRNRLGQQLLGGVAHGSADIIDGTAEAANGFNRYAYPGQKTFDNAASVRGVTGWLRRQDSNLSVANPNLLQQGFHGAGELAPVVVATAVDPLLGAAAAGAQGAHSTHEDALAHGATPEQADKAALISGGANAAISLVPGGGKVAQAAGAEAKAAMASAARRLGAHVLHDAAQGYAQRVADNAVAKATYDPNRRLTAGAGRQALASVATGAAVRSAHGAVAPAQSWAAARNATSAVPRPHAPDTAAEPATAEHPLRSRPEETAAGARAEQDPAATRLEPHAPVGELRPTLEQNTNQSAFAPLTPGADRVANPEAPAEERVAPQDIGAVSPGDSVPSAPSERPAADAIESPGFEPAAPGGEPTAVDDAAVDEPAGGGDIAPPQEALGQAVALDGGPGAEDLHQQLVAEAADEIAAMAHAPIAAAHIDAAIDNLRQSPIPDRSPELTQGFLQQITAGQAAHIDAGKLREALAATTPQARHAALGHQAVAEQLARASPGADVIIPADHYIGAIGPTPLYEAIRGDVRLSSAAKSPNQAAEFHPEDHVAERAATAAVGGEPRGLDDSASVTPQVGGGDEPVDLHLQYRPEWTPEQRAAADAKVRALHEGDTVVTKIRAARGSAVAKFRRALSLLARGLDVDHTIDLQLGGADAAHNLSLLDRSVNRSLGSQVAHRIKHLPHGQRIGRVTIGD